MTEQVQEEGQRFGGPPACPMGPCSECGPRPDPAALQGLTPLEAFVARHHFNDSMAAFAEDPGQDAVEPELLGLESWYERMHCPAWVEDLPESEAVDLG